MTHHEAGVFAMVSMKKQVQELVNRLPEEATLEEIQYHLYVLQKIHRGLSDLAEGRTSSQEEVESRIREWLSKFDGPGKPKTI